MLEDDETKQHAPRDPENALLGIDFDAVCSKFCKGLFKIGYEVVSPFGFDHDVINVGLNGPPDEVSKVLEHIPLVCSLSVLQIERHCDVAERSEGGDERCHELVGFFHRNLMVLGVRIKEAEGFTP